VRHPRRNPRVAAVAIALLGAGLLASCTPDTAEVSASLESPQRPAPEALAPPGGELSPEPTVPSAPTPDELPDAQQFAECVELTTAYTEVQVLAYTGDPEGQLDTHFEQLEAAAPTDVADELATIRSIVEGLGGDPGVIDATQALLSEEYLAANEVVIDWLATACGG
jgi:hypothetical protein